MNKLKIQSCWKRVVISSLRRLIAKESKLEIHLPWQYSLQPPIESKVSIWTPLHDLMSLIVHKKVTQFSLTIHMMITQTYKHLHNQTIRYSQNEYTTESIVISSVLIIAIEISFLNARSIVSKHSYLLAILCTFIIYQYHSYYKVLFKWLYLW